MLIQKNLGFITRGDDWALSIPVIHLNGDPLDFTGWEVEFILLGQDEDGDASLEEGMIHLTIPATLSETLEGEILYRLKLTNPEGKVVTWLGGSLHFES